MANAQYIQGWFVPSESGAHPEHPIVIPPTEPGQPPTIWPSPGHPEHPIVLPPLEGVWPPPGVPTHPIYYPPQPAHPIYIPEHPEHPIVLPPGTVTPEPCDCDLVLPPGKSAVLIQVYGVPGARWLIVDTPKTTPPKK